MQRSLPLLTVALLLMPGPACTVRSPTTIARTDAGDEARPNIILFLSDDQRSDVLGCAGHPLVRTPHLDRLAAGGVRFTNACVTTPICAASRASIFTGLHERTHGYTFGTPPVRRQQIASSYPALLRDAGYRTGFSGKFGIRVEGGKRAKDEMFDLCQVLPRTPTEQEPRHETDLNAEFAIDFIRTTPEDQPFCLSVSFHAPHAVDGDKTPGSGHYPWPASADDLYRDTPIPGPRLSDPAIFAAHPEFLRASMNRERYFWRWDTEEKYQVNMRAYYRMLSGIDHAIGRVLQALEEEGLSDNTIVIYSSDNGYYMGERGFAGKWSHFEPSLRVPLIIADPRQQKLPGDRRIVDVPSLNIDLAPTILALAGVSTPQEYQGASLVPFLGGQDPGRWRTDSFHEHLMENATIPKWEGVRSSRYVYARYFEQDPPYEFLHDLRTDPDQLINFRDDPAYRPTLERLQDRCDSLRGLYEPAPVELHR